MGKKKNNLPEQTPVKKKKKEQTVEKFPIDAEVSNFEARYSSIIPCVDSNLVRNLYEESIPENTRTNGVSWNITANFAVEKKFFLAVKELILEGDIDLEIAVIEQFMSIGRMLIRKLGYKGEDIDHKVETAITETIENYPGTDGFKSTLLQELKIMVNGKKEEKKAPKEELVIPEVQPVVPVLNPEPERFEVMPEQKKVVKASLPEIEEEKEIIIPEDGKLRQPTTLDYLLAQIDILKNSPLEDETYLKFLSLKYGYHNGQFFSLDEISGILSLPKEKVRDYYLQSLQYVKDWFGLQLDCYYTYLKTQKAND